MRFKLYKVVDDEASPTSLEGEVQYSLAELKAAHGIEQDNGFSVVLPPSSVSLSFRLMPAQNEERSDAGHAAAKCITPPTDDNAGTSPPKNMDWGLLSARANSLMTSYNQLHQDEDIEEAILILSEWYNGLPLGSNDHAACANSLGNAFHSRLRHSNSIDDLKQVVHYWSIALVSWTSESPYYIPLVVNLGGMLRRRFEWEGNFEDIQQAIKMYSAAMSSCPSDSPYRHNLLNNFASAVRTRFEQIGDAQDLDLSIHTHQECLLLRPPGHPSRFSTLSNLGDAICIRYRHKGHVDDLTTAMAYYRGALELCPAESPSYAMVLMNVGIVLQHSFERDGDLQNLDAAIERFSAALTACPENHPTRSSLLANYAGALYMRFAQRGDTNDLEYSIALYTNSLANQPPTHLYRFSSLRSLGNALLTRFNVNGVPEDLDLAITHIASSMALCGPSHPEHIPVLMSLINCLIVRYKERGDINDLDAAVEHSEVAIQVCPRENTDYFRLLTHANNALSTRFSRRQDVGDLKRIIDCCNSALKDVPHHYAAQILAMDRADALLLRYFHEGSMDDLEHTISCYQDMMQDLSKDHPAFSRALIQLASALRARFEQNGKADDINCAIDHYRTASEACPPGHIDHSAAFSGLGNTLLLRYLIFSPLDDLDESIVHLTHIVEARASVTNHPEYPRGLANLAHAIFVRFQIQHNITDLDIAVNYLHLARDHPNQSEGHIFSYHLATVLSTRYNERKDIDDLQESIKLFETALPMFSPHNPHGLHLRRNLARSLHKMYLERRMIDDLNAAIAHFEAYLTISPDDHIDLPLTLVWLAGCRHMRAVVDKDDDDFQNALVLLATASEKLPKGHSQFFPIYSLYTIIYRDYHTLTKDTSWLEMAFQYHDLASSASGIRTWEQLTAALGWRTDADIFHHPSALEAYKTSMKLLDRHIMDTPTISGRYKAMLSGILRDTSSLAADATACAISEGDLELAVELSEQGRGLLWSQMSRFRATIDDLRAVDDEGCRLADEFEFLSAQLGRRQSDFSSISIVAQSLRRTQLEQEARRYRQLTSQWEVLVAKIQQKQGFAYFLNPMSYKELKAAAIAGPVVIINASVKRCDGIIVTEDGPPRLIPLPHASLAGISTTSDDFRNVLRNTAGVGEEKMREKQLIPVLRRLWDSVLAPIVEELLTIVPKGSRVWWCPTSKLTSMPIHAAGPYCKGASNMPNIYVSSYTPTLSALIRSRRQNASKVASKSSSFVSIGQSKPNSGSGERELGAVGVELELVKSLVPPSMSYSEVSEDEGTVSGAIQALQSNSWVHLACHGKQDLVQPFDSSFALRDKPLRLLDIIQAELENPEFAFLSACHTAVGDKNTPDEVIHLAAGMQFSGFRGVIGTMWAVDDTTAHLMVKEFYDAMFSGKIDCTNAARALNKASKAVDKNKVPMDQRVVFIHIGA
ncbi:CHAT domain-containing protein [Suillus paluster]|uniref:CHAT domain-containing protein n=1 Tax=Suillus paluster TaxID=48578 RepID=UPI001B87157E|nr:CHAT domain-containing protein [Suillus paluster]KAG1738395.1 CHAT domain-containing protein [Suillus paluster]